MLQSAHKNSVQVQGGYILSLWHFFRLHGIRQQARDGTNIKIASEPHEHIRLSARGIHQGAHQGAMRFWLC
ncbi:beta-lactamase [Brucella sp. 09RB8471]|nr:beta-lactamase [Brucella sp. 09RB8471]